MEGNTENLIQWLYDAAIKDDAALLERLLLIDENLLKRLPTSGRPYTSPLLVACRLGHLNFISKLLERSSGLTEELDPHDGSSPLHVASKYGYYELVRTLVAYNPSMCFARDRFGVNPVHVAAMKGQTEVLELLMTEMPAAAKERLAGGETILHLCVKYNHFRALEMAVRSVGVAELLNAKNGHGNTILHDAVANRQVQVVQFLLEQANGLKKSTPNSNGLSAMDIFRERNNNTNHHIADQQIRLALEEAKVYPSNDIKWETETDRYLNWFDKQRSALMVVASLMANMAYQAGLNPPGGVWKDNQQGNATSSTTHTAGLSIMAQQNKRDFNAFIILNSVGFVASMGSIFLLICKLLPGRLLMMVVNVSMLVAILTTSTAYSIAMFDLMPEDNQKVLHISFGSLAALLAIVTMIGTIIGIVHRHVKQHGRF